MIFVKGQKVRITFPNKAGWFSDNGKIGTFVGMSDKCYLIYVDGSKEYSITRSGDKFTWSMNHGQFEILGQVQLLFTFMEISYEV